MARQNFWHELIEAVQNHGSVALLWVVASKGSSPGKAGAKMMILPDGTTIGTIGGGKVEFSMIRQALIWLNKGMAIKLRRLQHRDPQSSQASGQLCGGSQTIVYLHCTQQQLPLLHQLVQVSQQNRPCLLQVDSNGLSLVNATQPLAHPIFTYHSDTDWLYQENPGLSRTVYLLGGGHVSLALSQILALLEFSIVVIDSRQNLKTLDENQWTAEKITLPYSDVHKVIQEGELSSVIVMTHSHETDQEVITYLAGIDVGYFGILGSGRKLKILKQNLQGRVDQAFWKSIHAPAGLDIGSSTPMEIAVSIAAELIRLSK